MNPCNNDSTRRLIVFMLAAAAASLTLPVGAPLTVTVLGLLLFGVLHSVLEIRYLAAGSRPCSPGASWPCCWR